MVLNGKVKWFDEKKGFGFITGDDGRDLFVHYSDIAGSGHRNLEKGDPVSFEVAQGAKGEKAIKVKRTP